LGDALIAKWRAYLVYASRLGRFLATWEPARSWVQIPPTPPSIYFTGLSVAEAQPYRSGGGLRFENGESVLHRGSFRVLLSV